MQAVIYAVRDFLSRLRSWVVWLMCDNAVTVAYIKNEGGAPDRTLWCRWPYDCSSAATARRLRWFPSICQECTTSRRIPCPESARHWPRSGRWPWRVYEPCLPSGASYGSTCLQHSPTDDSSSSYHHIQTQGEVDRCHVHALGLQEGPSCTRSRHSRWSRKYCRRSLSHQEWRWFWWLNCNRQHHGSQSWWTYPKKIRFHCLSKVKTYWHKTFGPRTSLQTVWKLSRPFWEQRVIPGKLPTWCQGAVGNLHNKCMNPIGQDLWRSVGRKDGKCFESEVIFSAPTWCTSSGTDYFHRR